MLDETIATTDSDLHILSAGPLSMVVDAGAGARIRSLTWEGREVLTQRDVHPTNHGSTFWDAPQSAWNWPPRAVLDEGVYTVRRSGKTLITTSAVDPETGLTFEKRFRPNPARRRVEILYIITNNSPEREIDVAGWEVTRVPGGFSVFPIAPDDRLPPSALPVSIGGDGLCRYRFDADALASGRKLFAVGSEGWIAHARDDLLFLKRFSETAPGAQAPGHGSVEIWGQDGGIYIELENHGPLTTLKPRASLSTRVDWYVRPLDDSGEDAVIATARDLVRNETFEPWIVS